MFLSGSTFLSDKGILLGLIGDREVAGADAGAGIEADEVSVAYLFRRIPSSNPRTDFLLCGSFIFGAIFITRASKDLRRSNVWRDRRFLGEGKGFWRGGVPIWRRRVESGVSSTRSKWRRRKGGAWFQEGDLEGERWWEKSFGEKFGFEEEERESFGLVEGRRWRVGSAQGRFSNKKKRPKDLIKITSLP